MLATEIALNRARTALKEHPMCYRLEEDKGCVTVYFPEGFRADAAQMRFTAHGVTKTRAMVLLLGTCEKYWKLM